MNDTSILARKILDFFSAPLFSLCLEKDVVGHISKLFLVREDRKCLRLCNEMVDLAERLEEGCVVADLCERPSGQEIVLQSDTAVQRESLQFLFCRKNGNSRPSGIVFRFCDEDWEHYIVVGAAPFTLVFFSKLYSEQKASEYDLSEYQLETMR